MHHFIKDPRLSAPLALFGSRRAKQSSNHPKYDDNSGAKRANCSASMR